MKTMSLTKKQLLIPRYKVIERYPDSEFAIGEILDRNWCKYKMNDEDCGEIEWQVSDFPKIFQPLPWWSDRKLFELPEYVICIKTPDQKIMPGMVLKVAWCAENWGTDHVHTVILDTNCYEPATEEEYTAFINSNK